MKFILLSLHFAAAFAFSGQSHFNGVGRASLASTRGSSSALCMKYTLVLLRHGESTWNKENRCKN
eukprot:scaffold2992_cov214-Amphora_coffeaeformis.AAC.6